MRSHRSLLSLVMTLPSSVPAYASFLREHGGGELSAESQTALRAYAWPGNVRELRNRIRRAQVVRAGELITPADLDLPAARGGAGGDEGPEDERTRLEAVLRRHKGSVSRAAEELGTSRQALYRKMERLGVVLERRLRDE